MTASNSITAVSPNRMSSTERLDEVAAILAVGCRRLIARETVRLGANKPEKQRRSASTSPPARASMVSKQKSGE